MFVVVMVCSFVFFSNCDKTNREERIHQRSWMKVIRKKCFREGGEFSQYEDSSEAIARCMKNDRLLWIEMYKPRRARHDGVGGRF